MGARLEFSILGPLEVRHGGLLVPVGGPRQRALLALLLCNANRVVSRDRLVDELLGDQPADSAERLLRVQISRLRKAVAVDGDEPRVIARSPGYLLRVDDGELDLDEFERRLNDGRRALERGDPEDAGEILREAESLWRGRPLADLEFEPFARLEIERLEQLRLLAVEERIEADLALGRHTAVCPEVATLVDEYPLRERLRGQLMLALYRSGRQADALEVYRAGRSLLVEELALEPGPHLRQLERAILEQDSELELAPTASRHGAALAVAAPAERVVSEKPGSEPKSSHEHRLRARWAAMAVAIAAGVGAFAIAPQLGGAARRPGSLKGNVVALIAPGERAPVATVPLQTPPADVAMGFGSLWVTEAEAGLVIRVDPKRRAVIATIPVGTRPSRIFAGAGRVWVLDPIDRTLSGIDPSTDTVGQTVAVGGDPTDVAAAAGSLWIASHASDTVVRVDPRTGRTQSVVRTAGGPSGLAAAGDAVWVTNDQSGSVQRIDALTDAITATIRVGVAPSAIAATTGAVWVLDPLGATVSRIDPMRAVVAATIPLGGAPAGLTVFDGSVWVADKRHGVLFRVDPRRGAVTSTSQIGEHPVALTVGAGIWIAVETAGASHRGGTLTSLSSTAIDTIDPAASNSQNMAVPQQFGLTNDGLVALNHAAGPNGTRLVPDLAMALPVPSSNGRTYTFDLRPGIRYSTGALVEPRDVTHSFERLFELGSSGADWYEAITGAPGCARGQGMCDLSRGIVANDRADTVTFHLSRPDPDFLYKLTLTYADVLPASTPSREARTPLPATGPYMIARYAPGYELRLVRNPRFREWSAAAQPDGYPDQILIRLGLTGSQGATEVADGKGDFMPIIYSIPGTAAFRLLQHRGDIRVNAGSGGTAFLFLNVTVPPFNDLWVRRALNLALDRGRIVKLDGGAIAADPTCQILPPQLPGYHRYCPYTRDPRPDGRWHGPDLPRARRLVAASGTYAMKVAVWDTTAPQFALNEGNATVAALKQLGYRATLRLLPDSTYFTYTNDSRNHPQIIDGGWSTDYPSANDYIGKLTCRYFVPGNGPATTDGSEFCDPALDKQIARADTLQATDPSAAAALWAQLDRQLTDLAIWLPTVNGKEIDLIARRAGNYQYNPSWGPLLDQLWVR